jgi:chromosome segregation ATPase
MSFDAKEKRRLASSMHSDMAEEDDDFVDASETPMPASPARSRQSSTLGRESGKKKANERELENKVEELGMENKELKQTLDRLARRLQAFEMSAQRSTLALQESMRFVRDNSPARERESSNAGGGGGGASAAEELKRRVLELEEREAGSGKEIERLGRENEKLKTVVQRYRERWEKLKEGAKSRREGTSAGTSPKIEFERERVEGSAPFLKD